MEKSCTEAHGQVIPSQKSVDAPYRQPVAKSKSFGDIAYTLNKFSPNIPDCACEKSSKLPFSNSMGQFELQRNLPSRQKSRVHHRSFSLARENFHKDLNGNCFSKHSDAKTNKTPVTSGTSDARHTQFTTSYCKNNLQFSQSFNSPSLNNILKNVSDSVLGGLSITPYSVGTLENEERTLLDEVGMEKSRLKQKWSPISIFKQEKIKVKKTKNEKFEEEKNDDPKNDPPKKDGIKELEDFHLSPLELEPEHPYLSSDSDEKNEDPLSFSWPLEKFAKMKAEFCDKSFPTAQNDKEKQTEFNKSSPIMLKLKRAVKLAMPKTKTPEFADSCSIPRVSSFVCPKTAAIEIPNNSDERKQSLSKSWDSSSLESYMSNQSRKNSTAGLLAGNNFASPSPWSSGPGNDKWASFPNRKTEDQKESSNATPVSSNVKRTSEQTHPPQNPNTPSQGAPLTHPLASNTPIKPHARTPNQPGYSVETPTQIRHRNPSKEDIIGHKQALDGGNEFTDPWCITDEQREYYMKQFSTMQPDLKGKIDGQTARNFFTKSKLPILELSHIWELSDMDQDGSLTIDEFCTAFHLVVARKNGYDLPIKLPQALVPTLIDLGVGEVPTKTDPFQPDEEIPSQPIASNSTAPADQWETFSERTNSSTTLANFDQSNHSIEENLPHPVAVHMTPSRHPELWKRVSGDAEKSSGAPQTSANPYGSLRNELSDVDSSCEGKKLSASNSTDSKESKNNELEEKSFRKSKKGRSVSTSSVTSSSSSVATSDRSSGDEDDVEDRSDPEHSDWSSRPLRPRSGSSSSMESGSVPTITPLPPPAPTPPPRPLVHPKSSPKLKRESKSNSLERNENFPTKDVENRLDGPTPPPRPQPVPVTEPQESFADFSNFNQPHEEQKPTEKSDDEKNVEKKVEKKIEKKIEKKVEKIVKPVPAPRPNKESAKIEEEIESKDIEEEKSTHNKKAPTKPPRSRIMSSDVCKPEPILSTLPISSKDPKHKPQPKQELSRNKSSLQTSIRELKVRNTQLTRLNADLQQQLKDVMESRITVEMNIHQMRPFTQ
ncbi:uncharacterized protein LOC144750085 [Ciona intestinalis]